MLAHLSTFLTSHFPSPVSNAPVQVGAPGARNVTLPKVSTQKGDAEIEAVLDVDKYEGIQKGRNGDHEIVDGHITLVNAASNASVIDTKPVQLAMNVASAKDGEGLPNEIPLKAGDQIEVEGQYIPAARAGTKDQYGIIHFTHAPDGYAIMPDGNEYA